MKYVKIKTIKKVPTQPVYHITVDKYHNFFANKLCIHNCDYRGTYKYIFRLLPKWVASREERYDAFSKPILKCNIEYNEFPYRVGDRVGQIYLEKVIDFEFEETRDLSETDRGWGGFGSTGK